MGLLNSSIKIKKTFVNKKTGKVHFAAASQTLL